jgi:hypothetical protein
MLKDPGIKDTLGRANTDPASSLKRHDYTLTLLRLIFEKTGL